MKIAEILSRDTISIGLTTSGKDDLLQKMVDLADKSGKLPNKANVLKSVIERERIMSTGIGKNVALPHAKTNSIEEPVGAFAVLSNPIDFDSLDGEPIKLCFMLLGKENNVGIHLRLLSKISRFLNNDNFREQIINSKSSDEVLDLFEQAEE